MGRHGKIKIKLEVLLKESGLSKNKFSHMAEMERTQVNRYCNNTIGRLDLDVVARICHALHCEIGDLLEYEEQEGKAE